MFKKSNSKTPPSPEKPTAIHGSAAKPAPKLESALKPKATAKSQEGGCGIFTLLLLALALLAVGGGGYFVYTRVLKAGASGAPALQDPNAVLGAALPTGAASGADALESPTPKKKKVKPNAAATPDPNAGNTAQVDPNAGGAAPTDAAAGANAESSTGNGNAANAQGANPPPVSAPTSACAGQPAFLAKLGLGGDAQFSTNVPGTRGLVVTASSIENGGAPTKYQHQSWSTAGYLDAFVIDGAGNVYVAPSPRTGPGVSAPKNQNRIYKLDADKGTLAVFVTLPDAAPPSPENLYGVVGLAYDCDTNSLYVSNVSGSTAANPTGKIYRIDAATGQVATQLDNVDAFGMAVQSSANGKELFLGSTRAPLIRAVNLDAQGNFQGAPRTIATLGETQRARTLAFDASGALLAQVIEFQLNNPTLPDGAQVRLTLDAATNTWVQQP